MPAELLVIHPINPEPRKINRVVEVLLEGGVIIYPTDTIYGNGSLVFKVTADTIDGVSWVNNYSAF